MFGYALGGLFALKLIPVLFGFAFQITISRLQTWLDMVRCGLRDTLRLLGAIEIHRNRAVYVSQNTNANPTPNPNTNPNPNRNPNPNPNPK